MWSPLRAACAVPASRRRVATAFRACASSATRLQEFVCERRFDVVVAVGVLEYAPAYVDGRDPVVAFLERARAFLKPTGVLLIAIENQLGLKYFAGVAEDHTGELFFGVQDRYEEQHRYVTYGRGELACQAEAAGFPSVEYLYPFPDYKLPTLLFTHEALTSLDLPGGGDDQSRAHARRRLAARASLLRGGRLGGRLPQRPRARALELLPRRCGSAARAAALASRRVAGRQVPHRTATRLSDRDDLRWTPATARASNVVSCMTTRPAARATSSGCAYPRTRRSSPARV